MHKLVGILVKYKVTCPECHGKGRAEYPVYHNDYSEETCHKCYGEKVKEVTETMTLKDFKALIK